MRTRLISVKKIWDQAPHNAFTGLTRYNDRWFCIFREGEDHASLDGDLRLISSSGGEEWQSVGLFKSPHPHLTDMRDGKVDIAPDGRLMIIGAAAVHGGCKERQSYRWLSADGFTWGDPVAVGEKDVWMWDFTLHEKKIYSAGYGMPGTDQAHAGVRLYCSENGTDFNAVTTMRQESEPAANAMRSSETAILFHQNQGVALLRREFWDKPTGHAPATALLGTSAAPYHDWSWNELDFHVGGPALIALPDGRIIAGGRKPFPQSHTALWEVDIANGKLHELITLPSANDNSYPGLVWHENLLWVSYYSSHEGKADIYLAKLQIN